MQRLNYYAHLPEAFKKTTEIEDLLGRGTLDPLLIHLVKIRASQINGCTFCVDMHHKEARIDGERDLRLFHDGQTV